MLYQCVLEQNPPKQGLKPYYPTYILGGQPGFRAKSTKTRIETRNNRLQKQADEGFRAKSTKTRIETFFAALGWV